MPGRVSASVRIAVVSTKVFDELDVFYFSRAELVGMLQVNALHPIFTSSSPQWFAMRFVPNEAVVLDGAFAQG